MASPEGLILTSEDDYAAIRHQIGAELSELPDDYLSEPWCVPFAEKFVMDQVQNWQLIQYLSQNTPPAPTLAAVASTASTLTAGTYYAVLVARAAGTASPAGAEASQAITAGQALQVTVPTGVGITGYDAYVGPAAGMEFLQSGSNLPPGSVWTMTSFSLGGNAAAQAGQDQVNLKGAVIEAACAAVCRLYARRVPDEYRTGMFMERNETEWAEEEQRYLRRCHLQLGRISTYVPAIQPVLGMSTGHPLPGPNEPEYITGTDPGAVPKPAFQQPY